MCAWFTNQDNEMESYLTVLESNLDNNILIGACELGGTSWSGSLWLFENSSDVLDLSKCLMRLSMEVGAAAAKFLPDGQKIIASDYDGSIKMMELVKPADNCSAHYKLLSEFVSHDDYATCISVESNTNFVSGSIDSKALVWDIETSTVKQSMTHASSVLTVAIQPEHEEVFITGCRDGLLVLWDSRRDKSASAVTKSSSAVTSVDWASEWVVACGDEAGCITIADIRKLPSCERLIVSSSQSIRRLRSNRGESLLACAVDDHTVQVYFVRDLQLKKLYTSSSHKDCVSGLTWLPKSKTLLSCGWDTQCLSHDVESQLSNVNIIDASTAADAGVADPDHDALW